MRWIWTKKTIRATIKPMDVPIPHKVPGVPCSISLLAHAAHWSGFLALISLNCVE